MRRSNEPLSLSGDVESEVKAPGVSPKVVAWVSANVLPFEAELRLKLRRLCSTPSDIDDLIQDIYYRVLKTESVEHITNPKGFLMQVAKNILMDQYRRNAVVRIDFLASLDELDLAGSVPSTERVAMARGELQWVMGLIGKLPARCKEVFSARKIHGLSQIETAASLGISENVVEKEMMKGARLMAEMVKHDGLTAKIKPPGRA